MALGTAIVAMAQIGIITKMKKELFEKNLENGSLFHIDSSGMIYLFIYRNSHLRS